jgi:hypothetical protein
MAGGQEGKSIAWIGAQAMNCRTGDVQGSNNHAMRDSAATGEAAPMPGQPTWPSINFADAP